MVLCGGIRMKKILLLSIIPLLLLGSCGNNEETKGDSISVDELESVILERWRESYRDCSFIVMKTEQKDIYYLTDLYYEITFNKNTRKAEYISKVNENNEYEIREVILKWNGGLY